MDTGYAECVFCRQSLGPSPALEHIVPDSLGGWLTTRDVCTRCNGRFGREVDVVVDADPLVLLRREAGLAPHKQLPAPVYHPDLGQVVPVDVLPGGEVRPKSRQYRSGDRVTILGESPEEVQAIADKTRARAAMRGQVVRFGEPTRTNLHLARVEEGAAAPDYERFNKLLVREGSKIAIEYVARLGGRSSALDPRLDNVRSCALEGDPVDLGWMGHLEPDIRWLPRVGRLFGFSSDVSSRLTNEQYDSLLVSPDTPPPAVPHLLDLTHSLIITRRHSEAFFQLILFGWLVVTIPLPADLSLPWDTQDWRDLLQGRQGTRVGRLTWLRG